MYKTCKRKNEPKSAPPIVPQTRSQRRGCLATSRPFPNQDTDILQNASTRNVQRLLPSFPFLHGNEKTNPTFIAPLRGGGWSLNLQQKYKRKNEPKFISRRWTVD
jgi:hypothetical protein